jgi:hypothetical protein
MLAKRLTLAILLLLPLISCGGGESDFTGEHTAQKTLEAGEGDTISVPGGAFVQILADTYARAVTVMFSDLLAHADGDARYYPTGTEDPQDLIAGVVINTPADAVALEDMSVQFAVREGVSVTPGTEYAVYRFDYQEDEELLSPRWNRWGDTMATIDGTGNFASATIPTSDLIGFVGSLAIFEGLTVAALPAVEPTVISGRVEAAGGGGLATDVGLYAMVGAEKHAVDVLNGRAPALPDPFNEGEDIAAENTVDSAADGSFTIEIPECLIGQYIALEFGHESAGHQLQELFNVLDPAEDLDAAEPLLLLAGTENMVIWYGENKVISEPVQAGT